MDSSTPIFVMAFVFKIMSPSVVSHLDCFFYCTNAIFTVEYLCTSGPMGPLIQTSSISSGYANFLSKGAIEANASIFLKGLSLYSKAEFSNHCIYYS